jgi:hypothetical protein
VFLLESLVESHEWARKFATEGAYGTRAITVRSPHEIGDLLRTSPLSDHLAVA